MSFSTSLSGGWKRLTLRIVKMNWALIAGTVPSCRRWPKRGPGPQRGQAARIDRISSSGTTTSTSSTTNQALPLTQDSRVPRQSVLGVRTITSAPSSGRSARSVGGTDWLATTGVGLTADLLREGDVDRFTRMDSARGGPLDLPASARGPHRDREPVVAGTIGERG